MSYFKNVFTNLSAKAGKFKLGFNQNNNGLATLKNVNQLIPAINLAVDNTVRTFRDGYIVSDVLGASLSVTNSNNVTGTNSSCTGTCANDGTSCGQTYGFPDPKFIHKCGTLMGRITPGVGAGVYTLAIDLVSGLPYESVSVFFGQLNVPGFISVDRITNTSTLIEYTITTYNAAGVATANLFDNTPFELVSYLDTSKIVWPNTQNV